MRTITEATLLQARHALLFRRMTLRDYVRQAVVHPAFPGEKQKWEKLLVEVEAAIEELGGI